MADPAETEARAQLEAIAPRLTDAPHAVLGVPADASPEVLRAAFLRLTKQYHPTRYARFAPDVVRLANEVFLTIKRAYDQLHAPAKVATGTGSRPTTGNLPSRPAAGTPRAPTAPATATPRAVTAPVGAPPRVGTAPLPRRADTPPVGTPILAPQAPAAGKVNFNPPTAPPKPGTDFNPPTAKPGKPDFNPPTARPAAPKPATADFNPPTARPAAPKPATADFNPPTAPPRTSAAQPPIRPMSPQEVAMEPAMDLLRRKLWAEARQALLKLAVAAPQDKRYRAYMHYARGRESQEAGKLDEARSEWQRALGLDADITMARRALEELPPEPTGGGLLGRLFGKK